MERISVNLDAMRIKPKESLLSVKLAVTGLAILMGFDQVSDEGIKVLCKLCRVFPC